jgi:hypothetical protein
VSARSFARKLLRVAWLPVLCALIAGVAASFLVTEDTIEYQSKLLLVIPSSQDRASAAQEADSATTSTSTPDPIGRPTEAIRLAQSYAELIPNDSNTIEAVATATDQLSEDVRGKITAAAIPESALIQLEFVAPSVDQSTDGIQALEAALTSDSPTNDAIAPGSLVLVSSDGPDEVSSNSNLLVPSAVVLGFIFGGFLAVVWSRSIGRIDAPSDLDGEVEVPVMEVDADEPGPLVNAMVRGWTRGEPGRQIRLGLIGVSELSSERAQVMALSDFKELESGPVASVVAGSMEGTTGLEAASASDAVALVVAAGDRLDAFRRTFDALGQLGAPVATVLFIDRPLRTALPGWPSA